MNKKEIKEFIDNNLRDSNSQIIINIFKNVRNIKEKKLKGNIIIYPNNDFKHLTWYDKAISRVVARYTDIMLCLEIYEKYNENKDTDNIYVLKRAIQKVAFEHELDRVVYIRIYLNDKTIADAVKWQRGYVDKNHEFNEDILDMLDVSLSKINSSKKLSELEKVFKVFSK